MADSIKDRLEAGSLSFLRRELDRHWTNFIVNNHQPDLVRPEILESWQLCRDKYHIDPGMQPGPGRPSTGSSFTVLTRSRISLS
jgi:hypothetical protein